jgi:hypothetical protein
MFKHPIDLFVAPNVIPGIWVGKDSASHLISEDVVFDTPAASGNVYTITPAGSITFTQTATYRKTNVIAPTGQVSFSGAVPQIRKKSFSSSGSLSLTGSVPFIGKNILPISGTIVFSGTSPISFTDVASSGNDNISRLNLKISKAMGL